LLTITLNKFEKNEKISALNALRYFFLKKVPQLSEISRQKTLNLRLTNFEFEKISKIAEKLQITKTEALLRGIDLLIAHKPKKFKNLKQKNPTTDLSAIDDDIKDFL